MGNSRKLRRTRSLRQAPAAPSCMFRGSAPDCDGVAVRLGLCETCEARTRDEQLRLRAAARELVADDEEAAPPARTPAAAPAAHDQVLDELRRARADQLAADERVEQLLVRALGAGYSYADLAGPLGVTRQAVRQRHRRFLDGPS